MGYLLNLINSLEKEEKQFFRKTYELYGHSKMPLYAILFESIEGTVSQEDLVKDAKDVEKRIRENVKDERLLKHFPVYKNMLYEKLLDSLRTYHDKDNKSLKVKSLLQDIYLLQERSLFKEAHKRIKQAKAIAKEYHLLLDFLELLNIERRLIRRYERAKQSEYLLEIRTDSENAANQIILQTQILNAYDILFASLTNEFSNTTHLEEAQKKLNMIDIAKIKSNPCPFYVLENFYALKFNVHYTKREISESLSQLFATIQLYRQHPGMIKENTSIYLSALHNYMNLLIVDKQYEVVPSFLEEMRNIIVPAQKGGYGIAQRQIISRVFQLSYYTELYLYLVKGEYLEAKGILPSIIKKLELYQKDIPIQFQIRFFNNIAMTYFLNQDYEEVLEWVNRMLTLEDTHKIKMNTRLLSRLLQVIVHYELGDYGLVAEHFVPSFRSHLNRYKTHPEIKKYAPTYRILLSALSKASNATKDKKKKIFQGLAKQAREIPLFATILPWIEEQTQ